MSQERRQWFCTRQRAGPLVKESRSLRPRLSSSDDAWTRKKKKRILSPPRDSAVCRTRVDRLELRMALFEFEGTHYTLTFRDECLPKSYADVQRVWRAFWARLIRWKGRQDVDAIHLIEGRHGSHRYHIHMILRDSDFSPAEIRWLWQYGEADDEPLLRGLYDSYRRLAEYFCKEATDGITLPVGAKLWSCTQSLTRKLPAPERWKDVSGEIRIPKNCTAVSGVSCERNEFGVYNYAYYIFAKNHYKKLKREALKRELSKK